MYYFLEMTMEKQKTGIAKQMSSSIDCIERELLVDLFGRRYLSASLCVRILHVSLLLSLPQTRLFKHAAIRHSFKAFLGKIRCHYSLVHVAKLSFLSFSLALCTESCVDKYQKLDVILFSPLNVNLTAFIPQTHNKAFITYFSHSVVAYIVRPFRLSQTESANESLCCDLAPQTSHFLLLRSHHHQLFFFLFSCFPYRILQ
jgi:hypothetical protein